MDLPLFTRLANELQCVEDKKLKIEAKKDFDIVIPQAIASSINELSSSLLRRPQTAPNNADNLKTLKFSLARPMVMETLFDELSVVTNYLPSQKERCCAFVTASNKSAKDPFLNLSTAILCTIHKRIFSKAKVNNMHSNETLNLDVIKDLYPKLHDYVSLPHSTDDAPVLTYDHISYLTTLERIQKCPTFDENDIKVSAVVCGSFKVYKECLDDEINDDQLLDYLSERFQDLVKHAESRLEDDNKESVANISQTMLPFIVIYDFFMSAAPFDPDDLSEQKLRDAIFILYNTARIAHLKKSFAELSLKTDETNTALLTLDVEWELTCQLVMFYKVFRDHILEPFTQGGNVGLDKLLQYLSKLVKCFSKYYSSTKVVTYDDKESLIIRMNTRMRLVDSVYNVLTFCLRDILGVPIILNM